MVFEIKWEIKESIRGHAGRSEQANVGLYPAFLPSLPEKSFLTTRDGSTSTYHGRGR